MAIKPLNKYLRINGIFSFLSGFTLLFASEYLDSFFGILNPFVLPILGLNLLIFAIYVWYVAQKQLTNKPLVNVILVLDGLWVTGSLLLIQFNPFHLTSKGMAVIGLIAMWIAFLGYMQFKHNRIGF
jgi:hypothetical protein